MTQLQVVSFLNDVKTNKNLLQRKSINDKICGRIENRGKIVMFCEKCGAKLPDTAQFCTSCGNRVNILKKVPDTTVLLSVKPTFNFWYIIFPYIIDGLFMILLFTVPVAVIFHFIGMILGLVGMVIMAICISISTVFKKREYDNYSYDFYKTKVIYRDNYLNKAEKEVKYKYIREVVIHQTF